ncbi:IS1595 family transposase [Paenibacillus sp. LHD-117]|uniref:IS1595 family transposase n=1 Tax=Paenibacillus sp. LHD-117 TaxID=3071412 RepID=UPI0027E10249|nr:IS1595 family transposase [Paenibacillus sp. LHD-117]MDQ6421775.1 IS1595 family transposase [Paenibacillus sp. LHD-117]
MSRLEEAVTRFYEKFRNEADCFDFIEKMRWPSGFRCPSCDHRFAYRISTRRVPLFECIHCGNQTSLTSNTIMHKSRTDLSKWLLAIFLVSTLPNSITAVRLSAVIGVTYKTAWRMLHEIRKTISEVDEHIRLSGQIEAKHEIFMSDLFMTEFRMAKEKSVIIARENPADRLPRYKIKLIARNQQARVPLTEEDAYAFVLEHCSADLTSFALDPRHQFNTILSVHDQGSSQFVPRNPRNKLITVVTSIPSSKQQAANANVNQSLSQVAVEGFRWLNASFNGLGIKYAQHYLDEYCFRINHAMLPTDEVFGTLLAYTLKNYNGLSHKPDIIHSIPISA